MERRYKIGELAQLSGVPVKTVRYYSDLGVLPPSGVSETGHRWYTDGDHARLEAIRSLRDVGVGLETIQKLMQQEDAISEALRLHMETLELEMAQLQRRRALLAAALKRNDHLGYLRGARTLAALNARERQQFVGQQIDRMLQDVPADPVWVRNLWKGPIMQVPEDLSEEQFEAWLELADLMLDDTFIARSQQMGQEFWSQFPDARSRERFMAVQQQTEQMMADAVKRQVLPDSEEGQKCIQQVLSMFAGTKERSVLQHLALQQLEMIARHTEPRALHFWQLVEKVHGQTGRSAQVMAVHEWKVKALQVCVSEFGSALHDLHPESNPGHGT
ncbi:MerR family transcriptional regulator [Deinococcus cellulosilyticus]|uniref:MerR family transcriptional regulator n=1 Tax=Deinococcus cellulosilyticus (strain DSM 18568 / NBRC 106333 / KACC 11606 / 5516J-15) TaxID=1223518 RepID=A0A511MV48_DEIC1|nr:MerR family transcriptional regulator [Deinococcus cellulosilyticus]GEM44459.1 MerR family transcriptional regulator [Deinococcus cellulosilyticus NBRC 106333 = KACC 11606]